jgi:hypothetical protein
MGEPLKAALNSSCDISSNPRASVNASLPAIAARGANAGTFNSRANRTFHGHTSWEMCRQNRFELPIATGGRSLRKGKPSAPRT